MTETASPITVVKTASRTEARFAYNPSLVQLVKSIGLRWDPAAKVWWTTDAAKAARLTELASGNLSEKVAEKVAEINAERVESVNASFAKDSDAEIPCPDGLAYLPYQRAGIAYGMAREAVLIGDDMGLGKTMQALGIINATPDAQRILIICPASLKLNWRKEARKWLVNKSLLIGIAEGPNWPAANVVIANYDILAKHSDRLRSTDFDIIIIDEAHYLKNPKSGRAKAVLGDPKAKPVAIPPIRARRRVVLTGTPIPNRPIEIYPIVSWLFPTEFRSFWGFAKRYANAHQGAFGWDLTGASNLSELQEKLRVIGMVRRLKNDVLLELPPKTRQIIELPSGSAGAAVKREATAWQSNEAALEAMRAAVELAKASDDPRDYEEAARNLTSATQAAFTEISGLRHETALAKVPAMIEHLVDSLEDGHKIVFFCHHKDVAAEVAAGVRDAGFGVVSGTGDMSVEQRQASVERFQKDDSVKLFVATIMSMGVGHTLTASAHVVFGELDWVPGNVTQAEDRCHRIGQTGNVLVQHIVLEGSLDARMVEILVEKQAVIEQALDKGMQPTELAYTPTPEKAPTVPITPSKDRAGSEDTSRDKIGEIAARLDDEHVVLIIAAIRTLAGMNSDYCTEENGVGFNKLDTMIGMDLASKYPLTKRQAALALRICFKYNRTQLGGILSPCEEALKGGSK